MRQRGPVLRRTELARAIRFIRKRACRSITVLQVAAAAGLSRRVLERRFRRILGCTPKQEILRVQIDRARSLLSQTELPVEAVARNSGFPSQKAVADTAGAVLHFV